MANEQQRLIVELRAMLPRPGHQAFCDVDEWTIAVCDQHLLRPRQPQLPILRVEHFEQSVGDERQAITRLPVDRLCRDVAPGNMPIACCGGVIASTWDPRTRSTG